MPSALTDMRRISGRAETVDRHRDCDLLLTRYRGQEIGIARVVFGRTVERIDSSVRFFYRNIDPYRRYSKYILMFAPIRFKSKSY